MRRALPLLIWAVVLALITVPLVVSLRSPLLEWREPVYIVAGAAGVLALGLMLAQPLLAGGYLPPLSVPRARSLHRAVGATVLLAVLVHVVALWLTSPPDVIDALLFASPTPFSVWGVIAMWALIAAGLMALWRKRFALPVWRLLHTALAVLIVVTTVVHAWRVDGTMEPVSKALICACVLLATARTVLARRVWARVSR